MVDRREGTSGRGATGVDGVVLLDDATHNGLLARYGDAWLLDLPAMVSRETARLHLNIDAPLAGGRTACVLRATGPGGAVVLKLTPDLDRSRKEEAAVARLSSAGVSPRLYEAWESELGGIRYHGMLIELIGDGHSLRDNPSETPSVQQLAALLGAIAEAGLEPLGPDLEPATVHVRRGLDRGKGGGLHGSPPPSAGDAEWASEVLAELELGIGNSWVHGTLHPANLVVDPAGRLWAIDPRPFRADSGFDVAELALKLGSEQRGRSHNLGDGLDLLERLASAVPIDLNRAEKWLRSIVISGV